MKKTGHGDASLAQAYDELKAEKIHIQATLSDRCHRLVLESDEKDVLIEDLKNRISHMRRDNQKNKLLCEVDDWKELVTSLQLDRDSMSQDIVRLQSLLDEAKKQKTSVHIEAQQMARGSGQAGHDLPLTARNTASAYPSHGTSCIMKILLAVQDCAITMFIGLTMLKAGPPKFKVDAEEDTVMII
ncbi:hypothetical protein TrST_g1701 [Triparma strigata]|uniref:Uncharacterized protein n=1 Tax=Triparma strigata TaxID=1606541 RepID=A0A9W6ZMZ7_9STRA|nr:hypothetical protein TrST_g1701 [Triparma strigata]